MALNLKRQVWLARRHTKQAVNAGAGWMTVLLLRLVRFFDRKRTANLTAAFLRWIGPWLREHKTGRANLFAAFPEKSPAEIEHILSGVWDNLGRVAAEFAHLDRLTFATADDPEAMDIVYNPVAAERLDEMRRNPRPRVLFAAHLANWELPALTGQRWGLDTSV